MMDKIKGLRGSMYRRVRKQEAAVPGTRAGQLLATLKREHGEPGKFVLQPVNSVITLPRPVQAVNANITYPLIRPYAYANIRFDRQENMLVYNLIEPKLDEFENGVLQKIKEGLVQIIDVSFEDIEGTGVMAFLEENVERLLYEYDFKLSRKEYVKTMYYIYRDFVGLNKIEAFMHDPYIEDVGCDGVGIPVYIIHQKFGSMRTNVIYNDIEELKEFVTKLAERCDRYISYAEPLLDGTLKDGTRVQASLASDVTTRGPTFSLRKFREIPLTPVDMVKLNTASAEMLAYLWFIVENGSNLLITGGVSTGKTSLLNAISMFIPGDAKIVSIEDSVTGDTEIVIKDSGEIKMAKIGELTDRLLEEGGFTERITNKKGIEVLTMDGDYKMTFKQAGTFFRHKVNKDIYEITTASGRKVKATKDHSLFGLDENGEIVPATPEELQKLKFLAVPRSIPWEGKETKSINLLEHLDAFKGDFVKGALQDFFEKTDFSEFRKLGIPQQKYRHWKKNQIVEASAFKKLLRSDTNIELAKLQIIGTRSSRPLPVLFEISDEFLEFLGLWVGDGCYDARNKNRVIISNIDKECIDCANNVAEKLGAHITLMPDKISMSVNSTLMYKLMMALGFRGHADTKRVPYFVQNLSKRQAASFLRGYFSADGSVKNFEVRCSSQSLGLLNDIQTMLLRFGIISRISHYPRKDKCRELLISSNENVVKFKDIGFLQERKTAKVDILAGKKAHHTKTDVIPLGSGLMQEIQKYERLSWPYRNGLQNRRKAELSETPQNCVLQSIGRQFLVQIAEKRSFSQPQNSVSLQTSEEVESDTIERLAHSDIFWDRIKEVKLLPSQELYVYDISVPETENFVGGNILLHNTRELNLPHENWIPGVSRAGFGGTGVGEVSMFQLLRESFRQNPDYLIVGEIRGKEAYVMFQGMASIPGSEKVAVLNDDHLKFIPISELANREYKTFAVNPETGKIDIARVKARVMHRPQKELLKITTATGRQITVTPYHSLFTFDGGIKAAEAGKLKKGSSIAIPGRLPSGFADADYLDLTELDGARIFAPDKSKLQVKFLRKSRARPAMIKITPELLRLIGYYISEGDLNKSGKNSRIALYNKNEEILADMRQCIAALGGKPRERITDRGFGSATELAFSDKVVFELLLQKCGRTQNKKIPDFMFGLSKEKIGEFLSAMFAGDGYYSRHCFGYCTSSRQLADQIAHLLLMYGIVAHINEKKGRSRAEKEYDVKFYRREEREEFLRYARPIGKKAEIKDTKKTSKKNRFGDIFADTIKSIEKITLEKEEPVYDLVVPGVQNFLGGFGGITLHNSGHPSISTMHAGSVDDLLKRLQTRPISLSAGLLESLGAVIVMVHAREKGKSARRVKEIVEIESIDPETGNPRTIKSFAWIPHDDVFEYRGDSWLLHKISTEKGMSMNNVIRELGRRKKFMQWMLEKSIASVEEQAKYLNIYYKNPALADKLLLGIKVREEELRE